MNTNLNLGNKATREKAYLTAIEHYIQAIKQTPKIAKTITQNIHFAQKKLISYSKAKNLYPHGEPKKLPITVLVITWDIGHNPIGRSFMLAEVLQRITRHTIIAGFQFERYGKDIWEPVRNEKLPIIKIPGKNIPEILDQIDTIAQNIKPDLVIACKPRLPSVALAAAIKEKINCPVIIDIDDHELSFFKNRDELNLNDLSNMYDGALSSQLEPYSEVWTRLTQNLCSHADAIITSNVALFDNFGGTIIPHVRNEKIFNPHFFQKNLIREKFQIPADDIITLFFGTPRIHKGIDSLAIAINQIEDQRHKLLIVGTPPDKSVTSQLDKLAPGRVLYLPNQPFSSIPEILSMADVVCLPQDEAHPIAHYQLPAKAIDAIAMNIPLLVTKTKPMSTLISDGVATAIDIQNLGSTIKFISQGNINNKNIFHRREIFLEKYSYHSAALILHSLLKETLAKNKKQETHIYKNLKSEILRVTGQKTIPTENINSGQDIIIFWKQNDTKIYGRRHDMVIKYLESRPDVRKVIVFDHPLSEHTLIQYQQTSDKHNQNRDIYTTTYEKQLGTKNSNKIIYKTYIYPPGKYRTSETDTSKPEIHDDYTNFIKSTLEKEGITPSESIFWVYPKNYLAPYFINKLQPKKLVVDVVDDHRAWPGTSQEDYNKLTINYKELLERADIAIANCKPVKESMSSFNKNIFLIPNGCDTSPPHAPPKNTNHYTKLCEWQGNIIGFIGNLEAKIDIELLEKIAQSLPECLLVLIGSTHANPRVKELKKYKNIMFTGVIPYEEAATWVSKFDIGLVPHLKIQMTENMNPLKVFVYLSCGVPVVSTEVSNIDSNVRFIKIGSSHEQFISLVKDSLQEKQKNTQEIRQYVERNSWESRLSSIVDSIFYQTA